MRERDYHGLPWITMDSCAKNINHQSIKLNPDPLERLPTTDFSIVSVGKTVVSSCGGCAHTNYSIHHWFCSIEQHSRRVAVRFQSAVSVSHEGTRSSAPHTASIYANALRSTTANQPTQQRLRVLDPRVALEAVLLHRPTHARVRLLNLL